MIGAGVLVGNDDNLDDVREARYEWVLKDEPLVWLADALAGAVLAAERGDMTWLGELGEVTRTSLVRLPP